MDSKVLQGAWRWRIVGLLALVLTVPAAMAQTQPEGRAVTRPDGTTIYPLNERDTRSGSTWWQRDRDVGAEERERRRIEAQRDAIERQEMRTRERDAALQNPARQIPPTVGH